MPYSDIIDNRNIKLKDEINALLDGSDKVKFAVGYLYLSGFYQIAEGLGRLEEVKILTGNTLNKQTVEELAQSLASEEELGEVFETKKIQKKSERESIRDSVADAITNNLQALPHTLEREENIRRLSELVKEGRVKIKVYTKHPLHAKAYVFKYKKETAKAARAEGIGIIGSSNLTISGFHHNTELNTYVRGENNYQELNRWFDELWNEAAPFEEVLVERFEESWALKTVNPYDIYILTLYHMVKGSLEKQVSTIWNWEGMPPLYSFQKAAVMQAYQILNKFNGVFISDVVGLGKTFIGAGLLRHIKKRALIISPPGLIDMWKEMKEKFRIDAEVISRGMLYRGVYSDESIKAALKRLTFARYNLWDYVKEDKQHIEPYSDLQKVITTLKVFHKINLFKRLESSIFAFRMTIDNLMDTYNKFYEITDKKGVIPAGEKAADAIYRHELEDIWDEIEEITKDYKAEDFYIDRLKGDMLTDIGILEDIKEYLKTIPEDDDKKFDRLEEIISDYIVKNPDEKVLIFSEYADTVNYLFKNLKDKFSNVSFAHGDIGEEAPKKAAYFAPVANSYTGSKRIDIMVATDVLSEGYNLQDCSIVINYDLHWNPVRLIQRAGRIDRIGSEAEVIRINNFLPVDKVEQEINLKRTLRRRIEEIHKHIGEDSRILDESERLNEDAMYCIYEKRDMDEAEKAEEVDFSFDEAESLIKQLERDRPEYMALIKKMQLGLRSSKEGENHKGTYAFFRSGDIAKLFILTPDGNIIDDFSEVINEIRCENDCPETEITDAIRGSYFNQLDKLRTTFKDSLIKEELRQRPHHEVIKTKKRLQEIIGLFNGEEMIENIEIIDKVLNEFFPFHLIPLLKRLNKGNYSDEQYLNELIEIYNKEKLGEIINRAQRDRTRKQIEFICGEVLL